MASGEMLVRSFIIECKPYTPSSELRSGPGSPLRKLFLGRKAEGLSHPVGHFLFALSLRIKPHEL